MIDATHHEVIGLMSQAGTLGSVSLRIQRKMPPTGIESCSCIHNYFIVIQISALHLLSDIGMATIYKLNYMY